MNSPILAASWESSVRLIQPTLTIRLVSRQLSQLLSGKGLRNVAALSSFSIIKPQGTLSPNLMSLAHARAIKL